MMMMMIVMIVMIVTFPTQSSCRVLPQHWRFHHPAAVPKLCDPFATMSPFASIWETTIFVHMFFPQQQNAMGSLHNIDFGVLWASWGGSGKEPGSGNRFRELVPGTSSGNRIRVSMGSDRFCGSKVPVQKVVWKRFRRFRCLMGSEGLGSVPEVLTEPFLGTGFQEPEVLRRFRAKVSDTYSVLRKYTLLYFESVLLCFESMLLYVVVLCKYTFVPCHRAWAKKRW